MSIPYVNRTFVKFAVMIEDGDGDTEYVRGDGQAWGPNDPVLLFNTRKDAEKTTKHLNTSVVIEWR